MLTVYEHNERRNRCRTGLNGLVVRRDDSEVLTIRFTYWDEKSRLILILDDGDRVTADSCRLISKWPVVCCRPSRSPRRRKVGVKP